MSKNDAAPAYNDLTVRFLSALAMAALALGAVFAGGWWFAALAGAAGAVMMWEWRRISAPGVTLSAIGYCVAVLAAGAFTCTQQPFAALATLTVITGFSASWDAVRNRQALWGATGALYIGLAVVYFTAFRLNPQHGIEVVLFIALVVVATDAGAYFAGRRFGRRKLAPKISPNKTWAGLLGGVVAAEIIGGLFAVLVLGKHGIELLGVAAILSLASQMGDLAESAYKRRFGVKDAGAIIPGHGGLLDRFDGLLAAILAAVAITIYNGGASILSW
ncbi:MAG: phosphatidate cytidylyltransferase [Pikeienuella sp.]